MRTQLIPKLTAALVATCLTASLAHAQDAELNATGKKLEAAYEAQMKTLEADLKRALSRFDAADKAAYEKAREAETKARKQFDTYNSGIKGGVKKAEGLVNHAKGKWIGGAKHAIKNAEKKLKAAKNDKERPITTSSCCCVGVRELIRHCFLPWGPSGLLSKCSKIEPEK